MRFPIDQGRRPACWPRSPSSPTRSADQARAARGSADAVPARDQLSVPRVVVFGGDRSTTYPLVSAVRRLADDRKTLNLAVLTRGNHRALDDDPRSAGSRHGRTSRISSARPPWAQHPQTAQPASSARTSRVAATRFSSVAEVSGQARVLSPQSGLTHRRPAGRWATATRR